MGRSVRSLFDLSGRVAVITGGGGLLGIQHAEAIAEFGGIPVLIDLDGDRAESAAASLVRTPDRRALGLQADITQPEAVNAVCERILSDFGRVDILVNNAARNPTVGAANEDEWSRFERFSLETWNCDVAVGLTGPFLCSQILGGEMASRGGGAIVNVASDLGVIGPDQRIYRRPGLPDEQQPVKPVSYSVVKHGLIGLTRYLATYWADRGVRVNAISPGGVYTGQEDAFVERLANLIPMGRMAERDEYKAAVVFLASDASSYMTGANLIVDGGRTSW